MRWSRIARGMSATAAALLLTACGGGSDDESAPSTTSAAPSSAAESSSEAPQSGSGFCTEARAALSKFASVGAVQDPAQAGEQFQQAAEEVRGIEPPSEIADDWTALADGLAELAGTVAGATSNNDPEAAAQFTAQVQELQQSATGVATYLQQECGLQAGDSGTSSGSPAPSS